MCSVTPKESSQNKKVNLPDDDSGVQFVEDQQQPAIEAVTSIDLKTNNELLDDDDHDDDDDDEHEAEMLKFHHKAVDVNNNNIKKDEEIEGGEGGAAYEEFMQALMEMSNKDINALQSFIAQAEQEEME